ncbi:MAG: sulfatase-like hydrolase/transferase [Dehalococcoidia bacterium]
MKRFSAFHPFLLSIFPILFLAANNMDEVRATDLLFLLPTAVIGTLLLMVAAKAVTKSYQKAAIITSWTLALFYSYGYVSDLLSSWRTESFTTASHHWFLEAIWLLLLAVVALPVIRARRSFLTMTKLLNVIAAVLVAISLFNMGTYAVRATNLERPALNEEGNGLIVENPDDLPDIYYIILDSYGRDDTLSDVYDYDNSEFTDYLTDRGFYVASGSRANYSETVQSVASSLNMEYPAVLQDGILDTMDSSQLTRMIVDSEVSRLLKSVGYRYILVFSGWNLKDMNEYAEVYSYAYEIGWGSARIRISSFAEHLLGSTALGPLADSLITAEGRNSILYFFDALSGVVDARGPKFVLAHVTSPHPPWYFDRDGGPALPSDQPYASGFSGGAFLRPPSWYDKERYVDQLAFVNSKIEPIIEAILSGSDTAPIIIVQADHGPWTYPNEDGASNETIVERQMAEKMRILNAYYLPGKNNRLLYESITPVNSFRVVFNLFFGTTYQMLPEESYFAEVGNPRRIVTVPPE